MTFDTARAAAIAKVADALYEEPYTYCEKCKGIGQDENANFWCSPCKGQGYIVDADEQASSRDYAEIMAETALSALLAARSSTTCETCGGTGENPTVVADGVPCRPCDGSGTVPGGPLLILVSKQVGWLHCLTGWFQREVRVDPGPMWSPVYRARESFEEKP